MSRLVWSDLGLVRGVVLLMKPGVDLQLATAVFRLLTVLSRSAALPSYMQDDDRFSSWATHYTRHTQAIALGKILEANVACAPRHSHTYPLA